MSHVSGTRSAIHGQDAATTAVVIAAWEVARRDRYNGVTSRAHDAKAVGDASNGNAHITMGITRRAIVTDHTA